MKASLVRASLLLAWTYRSIHGIGLGLSEPVLKVDWSELSSRPCPESGSRWLFGGACLGRTSSAHGSLGNNSSRSDNCSSSLRLSLGLVDAGSLCLRGWLRSLVWVVGFFVEAGSSTSRAWRYCCLLGTALNSERDEDCKRESINS